jgi:hypothetical protein
VRTRRISGVATALAALCAALIAVPGASATTEPTNFIIFNVQLVPGTVKFAPQPTAERGTTGEFKIYNKTKKPLRFELAGRMSKLVKPKAHTIFFLLLYERGTYTWRAFGPNAPTLKGTFEVT